MNAPVIGTRLAYDWQGARCSGTVRGAMRDGGLRVAPDGLGVMHDLPVAYPVEMLPATVWRGGRRVMPEPEPTPEALGPLFGGGL